MSEREKFSSKILIEITNQGYMRKNMKEKKGLHIYFSLKSDPKIFFGVCAEVLKSFFLDGQKMIKVLSVIDGKDFQRRFG